MQEWDYHTYLPERSVPLPPDQANITTLNMPLLGVLAAVHGLVGPAFHMFLDVLLATLAAHGDPRTDALFTTRSVQELAWGYEVRVRAICMNAVCMRRRSHLLARRCQVACACGGACWTADGRVLSLS